MNAIADFFRSLFDLADGPLRWYTGHWNGFHGWLYMISGLLIGAACFTAPVLVLRYIKKAQDAGLVRGCYVFMAFLLALGTMHFLDILTFRTPVSPLHAVLRFLVAVIGLATIMALLKYRSPASSLRSEAALEKERARRKQAEEKLLLTQRRFECLVQEGGDVAGIFDKKGKYVYLSPMARPSWGIEPGEMIGRSVFDNLHPGDVDKVTKAFCQLTTKKRVQIDAFRYRLKSGEYSWTEAVLTNLQSDPAVQGIVFNFRNVTDRVKNEAILQQRNAELATIFECSRDIICAINTEGAFVKQSRAFVDTLGYTPKELMGRKYWSLVVDEDLQRTKTIVEEIKSGHPVSDFENTYHHKDGSRVPLLWSARWFEPEQLIYCIARNASETIRWEKIIEREQQRFARMFAEAPFSMCILKGPDHVFEDINEKYSLLTGRKNVKGKTVREVFPELKDHGFFGWLDAVYQTGETYAGKETPLKIDCEGNGRLTSRYISFIYQPFFDNEGRVEGIFYFGIDVTEQVEMRRKLEQSEKRFRSLIENSHDILVLVDKDGYRNYVSPAFRRTLGYDPQEAIGKRCIEKVHPEDVERMQAVLKKVTDSPGITFHASARYQHKDGHFVWLDGSITNMLHVEEVNAIVYNYKDIEERKRAEEERELIFRINNAFTQKSSLKSSLDQVLKEVCSFANATGAEAWMISIDNREFGLVSSYVKYPLVKSSSDTVLTVDNGIPGEAWKTKSRVVIENIQESEICVRKEFAKANHIHAVTAIPVLFNDQVIAVILLYNYVAGRKGAASLDEDFFIQLASEIQRKKTEEELDRFFTLSGDLLCIAGVDGFYRKVNPAFGNVLGYTEEELLTIPFIEFIHPDDRQRTINELKALSTGKATFNFENRFLTKDKKIKYLVWTATPTHDNLLFALAKDVTEFKRAKWQAENYSRRIGVILESITDAFFAIDSDFTVTYWNKQAAKILGVPPERIIGRNLWEAFPDAVPLKFYTEYNKALAENRSVRFEEYFAPLKIWFDVSAYPSEEGLSVYFRDITQSKNIYQNLVKTEANIRSFARQLNTLLEEERSSIAREIHDEFGQQLASIKMSISSLKKEVGANAATQQKLADIMQDVDKTMQTLRNVATELRPGILDTMGLVPSLEWLAAEFEKKTGIICYIDVSVEELDFEKTFATCYFRICQEALTNVVKHAKAKHVAILVNEEDGCLVLQVIDDGIGIVEDKIQNPFSMGLLCMKERANLIGGSLVIQGGAFEGTIVQLKARIHAD